MSTLTKSDIAEHLFAQFKPYNLTKSRAYHLVDMFFEEIASILEAGDNLKLTDFGNFSINNKAARPGRNPKTGETVMIAARRVVTFKAGNSLKLQLKESEIEDGA